MKIGFSQKYHRVNNRIMFSQVNQCQKNQVQKKGVEGEVIGLNEQINIYNKTGEEKGVYSKLALLKSKADNNELAFSEFQIDIDRDIRNTKDELTTDIYNCIHDRKIKNCEIENMCVEIYQDQMNNITEYSENNQKNIYKLKDKGTKEIKVISHR